MTAMFGRLSFGTVRGIPVSASGSWLLVVFVLVERRVASPLVDMVTNARPALLLTNISSVCVGFVGLMTALPESQSFACMARCAIGRRRGTVG